LRRTSWRSPRSKGRPPRSWLGIASWARPCCVRETSRKPEHISIAPSRSLIPPSIVRWRRDLAKTSEWQACPTDRWSYGCLANPKPALADTEHALKDAREIGPAATLMYALFHASFPLVWCGNYTTTNAIVGRKRRVVLEGPSNEGARSAFSAGTQIHGRSPNEHLRTHRMAVNGIYSVCAVLSVIFSQRLRVANSAAILRYDIPAMCSFRRDGCSFVWLAGTAITVTAPGRASLASLSKHRRARWEYRAR
jgi:hypothetical protein